jgi:hypothetical protein
MTRVRDVDAIFHGSEYFFNWCQEFENELGNEGMTKWGRSGGEQMRMGGLIGGGKVRIRGAECCRQVTVESPAAHLQQQVRLRASIASTASWPIGSSRATR